MKGAMVMAKSRRKPRSTRKKKTKQIKLELSQQVSGLLFIILGIIGLFNFGYIGTLMDNLVRIFVGDTYQVALGLLIILGAYLLIFNKQPQLKARTWLGASLTYLASLLALTAYFFGKLSIHAHFLGVTWQYLQADIVDASLGNSVGGGLIGAAFYSLTYFLLAQIGTYIISSLLVILGLCLWFKVSFNQVVALLGQGGYLLLQAISWCLQMVKQLFVKAKPQFEHVKFEKPQIKTRKKDVLTSERLTQSVASKPQKETILKDEDDLEEVSVWDEAPKVEPKNEPLVRPILPTLNPNYKLPDYSLLSDVGATDQSSERKAMQKNKRLLEETLASFGVEAKVVNAILGPAVTKYELHPAIGVKVSKIVNLSDDLALALAAKDLRIEAPIPGKSLVGIEVPNQNVATVSFKSIITAQKKNPAKPLEVPLGRDISGQLITADLAKMPHLLIAGSTGSGKSVAINGIITSLLMNCTPDQVKLVLIDPKKVELGVYNDIAHLLIPVVTNPKKAAGALQKLVSEMERRYECFADTGQRNISGYNAMIQRQKADGIESDSQLMPYIVIIVDELSDLMMTASNDVEDAIVRLAQMARAAGIHMILATQRPSVDVITGLIKANVPSRMAFAVSSGTDSRTIIDQSGAEKLLGRGDMLFLPMGSNKPIRVQGAFISDQDVEKVVNFVKTQQEASYDTSLEVSDEELDQGLNQKEEQDELFSQVIEFITQEQKCSISLLQRRFKIGYNRAARIVDQLADAKLIGPQEGSKPRKVYLPKEEK